MKTADSSPYGEPLTSVDRLVLAADRRDRRRPGRRSPRARSPCPSSRRRARWPRRTGRCRASGARSPPVITFAPWSTASRTWRSVFAAVASLLTGPIVVASSNGSPRRIRSCDRGRQLRDELLAHRLVDQDALARRAALPRVEEARRQRGVDGRVEVGVLEDHERAVAAHLQQQVLARGARGDRLPGGDRADEPHRLRPGFAAISSPTTAPGPVTMLTTPGGSSAASRHPAHRGGTDDVVRAPAPTPRRSRTRSPAPGSRRHRVRPVPRADDRDDAARHAVEQHPLVRVDRRRHQALHPGGVGGRHLEVGDQLLDLVARLGPERLALIERERVREVVTALVDHRRRRVHRGGAVEGAERRPAGPRRWRPRSPAARRRACPRGPCRSPSPVDGLVASNVAPSSASTHVAADEQLHVLAHPAPLSYGGGGPMRAAPAFERPTGDQPAM